MRLFLLLFFLVLAYANTEIPSDMYEPRDLGECTECHRQVYPTKSLDKYKKEYIDVFYGKNEFTCIYFDRGKPILYRYEKDNKITYLFPSKITDNPPIIK